MFMTGMLERRAVGTCSNLLGLFCFFCFLRGSVFCGLDLCGFLCGFGGFGCADGSEGLLLIVPGQVLEQWMTWSGQWKGKGGEHFLGLLGDGISLASEFGRLHVHTTFQMNPLPKKNHQMKTRKTKPRRIRIVPMGVMAVVAGRAGSELARTTHWSRGLNVPSSKRVKYLGSSF